MKTEEEVLVTDEALADQWYSAVDHASRLGQQLAWLQHNDTTDWFFEFDIRTVWTEFKNQFDVQVQRVLHSAFHDGYTATCYDLLRANREVNHA